jgi:hypothetical protein
VRASRQRRPVSATTVFWGEAGRNIAPVTGEDAAGNAKGPIDRIGRFVIVGLDQAS